MNSIVKYINKVIYLFTSENATCVGVTLWLHIYGMAKLIVCNNENTIPYYTQYCLHNNTTGYCACLDVVYDCWFGKFMFYDVC